uniref:Methyltransferase domain-containing protein n=1 Tax=Ditylum brightwellii TaxID=49249 RepID=A0A7S4RDK1_9STRA
MASNNNRNNADDKMDEDDGMIPLELNDEEDDILEIQGLLGDSDRDGSWISSSRSPQFATRKTRRRTTARISTFSLRKKFLGLLVMGTLSMFLGYILMPKKASENKENSNHTSNKDKQPSHDITSPLVTSAETETETSTEITSQTSEENTVDPAAFLDYICPTNIGIAINDRDGFFEWYDDDTAQHALKANNSEFEGFLDEEYGSWGITPNERKALNANWIHWYGDHLLHSESRTIYESACGTGLTLFIIIQLLYEQYDITGIEAFGNEYIAEDVVTANRYYDWAVEHYPELDLRKGRICRGDSTNLTSFVPTNAFDIVMTGSIDVIDDPLHLGVSDGEEHRRWCTSKSKVKQTSMKEEQKEINRWFALWASQMISLVKSGGIVIIEANSKPRCEVGAWGGVSKEWWAQAIQEYEWDTQLGIDSASLDIIDFDPPTHYNGLQDRYNVKMTKRK